MRHRAIATALLLVVTPTVGHAHPGRPLAPHDLWRAWTLDLEITLPLVLVLALYVVGTHRLRTRARLSGSGPSAHRTWFLLGWLALAVALVSPLHAMGEVLLTGHMVQHELLIVLAAPLLVLSRPLAAVLWGLPTAGRHAVAATIRLVALRAIWHRLTSPLVATVLHGAAIWVWHAPRLYEATLTSSIVHATQHASFFVTALLFWWSVLRPSQRQARSGAPVLALFTTMMHSGLLGALIATAPALWYGAYATTTAAWGLTPLEDQQLAGLVMWIPASVSYVVATLVHATRWLREPGGTMARQGAFRAH